MTRVANAKVYEKGNALVFELDRASRETNFYKKHIEEFESEMRDAMRQEYSDSLAHKDTVIDISKKHTFDLMNSLVSEFKALSTQQEIETIDKIKAAKDKCIFDSRNYVGSVLNKPEATTVIS